MMDTVPIETLELKNLRLVYHPVWHGSGEHYEFFGFVEHEILVEHLPTDLRERIVALVSKVEEAHGA
jgi:hypothetical protein